MPKKVKTKKEKWSEIENNLLKPAFKDCVERAKKPRVIWAGLTSGKLTGVSKVKSHLIPSNYDEVVKFLECLTD